jgi:hypothetical protein
LFAKATTAPCQPKLPASISTPTAAASALASSSTFRDSRPEVLALFYEHRHNVVLTRVFGVLSSADIAEHDRALLNFLAGKESVRGLYDFSAIDALAVPISKINQRGQTPPIIDGMRVVVAPPGAAGMDFTTRIADQLRGAGHREPQIVGTLAEAYRLLEIDNPQFERID